MSYLGNAPARSFISFERQVFTIVNSQTAYALSHSVTNENDIRLVVNNVVQEPGSGKAYTATGTALTLSAALTNGTDEMYCVFLGRATATSAPGAGSIGTAQLASDSVTLAKMAPGTDGNIISYDASGNPVAVATGNDGQVLTSAGAGAPPVFETPASAANSDLFLAIKTSNQTINTSTTTLLTWDTERYDTGNNFASNAYTVPSDGYYYLYAKITINATPPAGRFGISIMSGSTTLADCQNGSAGAAYNSMGTSIIVALSANDVIDVDCRQTTGSTTAVYGGSWNTTVFGGYKLNT